MVADLQQLLKNKRGASEGGERGASEGGDDSQELGDECNSPPRKTRRAEDSPKKGSPKRVFPVRARPAASAASVAAAGKASASSSGAPPPPPPPAPTKLPKGWKVAKKTRTSGASAGKVDTYFVAPDGEWVNSWPKVLKKLAALSRP